MAESDPRARISYSTGVPAVAALALLRVAHTVLPAVHHAPEDYSLGVHDSALWAALHAYLLVGGALPCLVGLAMGVWAVKLRPDDTWGWVGCVTNGAFVVVAGELGWVLARQGYFAYVLSALPRFLDV